MEKYDEIFMDALGFSEEDLAGDPIRSEHENWNSLAHVMMVSYIEDAYGVIFDPEDILKFDSYRKGKELLEKYLKG